MRLDNVYFAENEAVIGGGLYLFTGSVLLSNQTDFFENFAIVGGGASVLSGDMTVDGSTFSQNMGIFFGGAFMCFGNSDCFVSNSLFDNNTALTGAGGAGFITNNASIVSTNNIYQYNIAREGGAIAVGLTAECDMLTDQLYNNSAQLGGGIFLSGLGITNLTNVNITYDSIASVFSQMTFFLT